MNNYEINDNVGGSGGLINTGGTLNIPAAGSDDSKMLNQQTSYATMCNNYIGEVTRFDASGRNITDQVQRSMMAVLVNTPLTFAQAQAYFPAVSAIYWASGCTDYLGAYNAIILL
jgi:hypothetical protein